MLSSGPLIVAELTSLSPGHLTPIFLPGTSSKYGDICLADPITCPNPPLAGAGLVHPPASPLQRLGALQVSEKSRLVLLRAPMLRVPGGAAVSHWLLSAVTIFPGEPEAWMMVY